MARLARLGHAVSLGFPCHGPVTEWKFPIVFFVLVVENFHNKKKEEQKYHSTIKRKLDNSKSCVCSVFSVQKASQKQRPKAI